MKRMLFILMCVFTLVLSLGSAAFATPPTEVLTLGTVSAPSLFAQLGTFTGIIALLSLAVTEIAKLIPTIANSSILKILTSCLVGVLLCFISFILNLADFLNGLIWYQVVLYGIAAGLSGSGFYDLSKFIRSFLGKPQTE